MIHEEFPHTVTFQKEVRVKRPSAGHDITWEDFIATEAFICPISSRERYIAQQNQSPIDYNVYYPYQEGIKSSMRVKWGTKYFEVKSSPIDQGGQGEIHLVKCASIEVKVEVQS